MRRQLTYFWWAYLLYGIIAVSVTISIYHEVETPNENEIIRIALAGQDIDVQTFQTDLLTYLNATSDQTVKDVSIEYMDLANFEDALATRSLGGYDLIILPTSQIRENTGSYYFLPIESIVTDFGFSNATLYTENDVPFGIVLNEDGTINRFTSLLNTQSEELYVVFINVYSVNIGPYNDYGDGEEVAAIETLIWLLGGVDDE